MPISTWTYRLLQKGFRAVVMFPLLAADGSRGTGAAPTPRPAGRAFGWPFTAPYRCDCRFGMIDRRSKSNWGKSFGVRLPLGNEARFGSVKK
jgi:hypothetical protein